MNGLGRAVILAFLLTLPTGAAWAQDNEGFDTEKLITDLEKKIELTREQWDQLKPVLEEKSRELKEQMQASVEKGFAEFDKLSDQFDRMSRQAEAKAKEVLSSEEVQKLRNYLRQIDEEAIRATKDKMAAELTALLELSEEQARKVKPVIEDSFAELSAMLDRLAVEGKESWSVFKQEFDRLSQELHDTLQEFLDKDQMERLDKYNKEKKEKIQHALFNV